MTITPSENKKTDLDPSVHHEAERHLDGSVKAKRKEYEGVLSSSEQLSHLKGILEKQYRGLSIDKKHSFEQVLQKFTGAKLEIADSYETPYLLMIPVIEGDSDKITGYKPVIAEGKPEMDSPYDGDNLNAKLQDRAMNREEDRRDGEAAMTRVIYDPLFTAAKKAGKPIDEQYWIMLDGDYKKGDLHVPFARSNVSRPYFGSRPAGGDDVRIRLRSAVEGDVLSV